MKKNMCTVCGYTGTCNLFSVLLFFDITKQQKAIEEEVYQEMGAKSGEYQHYLGQHILSQKFC